MTKPMKVDMSLKAKKKKDPRVIYGVHNFPKGFDGSLYEHITHVGVPVV